MTRGPFIGGNDDMIRAPYAPYSVHTRRDSFSLPSALPLEATRLHGTRGKPDHAPIYRASMQAGSNTSPELFVSVVAGACGEEKPPFSFQASSASLERPKFVQTLIDVGAAIFAFLFIALVGLSVITAILILLFVVSFH